MLTFRRPQYQTLGGKGTFELLDEVRDALLKYGYHDDEHREGTYHAVTGEQIA